MMAVTVVEKSCTDCIFFKSGAEAADVVGRNIYAGVCSKFNMVLDRPDWSDEGVEAAHVKQASSCSEYVNKYTTRSAPIEVFQGYDGLLAAGFASPDAAAMPVTNPEMVSSCFGCMFFVPEVKVGADAGWASPACVRRGALLTGRNKAVIAEDCDYKSYSGETQKDMSNFTFYPTLMNSVDVQAKAEANAAWVNTAPKFIEPEQYPTDLPVTREYEAMGIRAWRKIVNPDDQNKFTHIPIFSRTHFSEEDQKNIPSTGDDTHPELYIDHTNAVYKIAVLWQELDETPALWGEAGSGKTELLRHMAWMMVMPFERISITASSEIDDIAGKMNLVVDPGTGQQITDFKYGRVPKAWTRACVMCVDEPNVGPQDVWQFMRPLTDNSKQLVLDQNRGEVLTRHEYTYLGLAMNPAWDPRNEGANTLADPDSSRLMHIWIDLPPKEIEMKIIAARVELDGWHIEKKYLDQIMAIADTLRELCRNGTIPGTWGIRHQLKAVRAMKFFTPAEAYRLAAADYFPPGVQSLILDAVSTVMKAKVIG